MKQIKVIGIGMGDEASMTVAAKNWIRECDLLIGASRMVQAAAAIAGAEEKKAVTAWQPEKVWDVIRESRAEKIAVLMSGDISFFSGARALREEVEKNIRGKSGATCEEDTSVRSASGEDMEERNRNEKSTEKTNTCEYEFAWLPGISSMAYFCAAVGIPYEDAHMLSIHGRSTAYVRQIAVHEKTFLLTDGDLPGLGEKLLDWGLKNVTLWVGMDLASPAQRILKMTPEKLAKFSEEECRPLTVCLILNPDADKWRDPYRRDEEFCRDGKTPMTKEEVRGIILGKLQPGNRDIIYDIGGGSGSVSVACAIAASGGTVYSVECDPDAVRLIGENRRRFACDNIEIIAGRAPEALQGLPVPDRIFIGGSGGEMDKILAEMERISGLPEGSAGEAGDPSVGIVKKSEGATVPPGGTGENIGETEEIHEKGKRIRIVISSVTLETNAAVSSYLHTSPHVRDAEVCQLAVTKSKRVGGSTLMMGQNPVTIFSFDFVL